MRSVGTSAALALVVAAVVSGCGGSSTPAAQTSAQPAPTLSAPTQPAAPSASPPSAGSPSAAPSGALAAACTRYGTTHVIARQVADAAASPILASGPAFFLITLRQTATDAISSVPASAAVFTELRNAIDDLNGQASKALPPGADGAKTLVKLQPARLGAALDAVDTLCASAANTRPAGN